MTYVRMTQIISVCAKTSCNVAAVVHPVLQGPAEGLVEELQASVKSVFQVVVGHVYAEWPALHPVIMEQVCTATTLIKMLHDIC